MTVGGPERIEILPYSSVPPFIWPKGEIKRGHGGCGVYETIPTLYQRPSKHLEEQACSISTVRMRRQLLLGKKPDWRRGAVGPRVYPDCAFIKWRELQDLGGFKGDPGSFVFLIDRHLMHFFYLQTYDDVVFWKTVRNTRGAGDRIKDQPDPFLQQIPSGKSSTSLTHKIRTFPTTCRDEICLFTVLAWWICRY